MSNLTDFMFPKATEQQAKDGVSNSVLMTPQATKQYVDEQKGKANGIAGLAGDGRLPLSQATGVGVGQTWQAVSRDVSVSYQNVTGRPIVVAMFAWGTSTSFSVEVSPDNTSWITASRAASSNNSASGETSVVAVVPDSWYYRYGRSATTGNSIRGYSELR